MDIALFTILITVLLLISIFVYYYGKGYKEFKELNTKRRNLAFQKEKALNYSDAAKIWEELGEIKEAARVRKLKAEQGAVKVSQKVVHGDEVTKTEIKDSVVSKSNIGSGGDDKLTKIKELKELHDAGAIDDDEFKQS